jgi:P4 family phage/plasmid primase-like protien
MNQFLTSHACKEKSECTHTRIGSPEQSIYGGSYTINDLDKFFPIYFKHVFEDGHKEYLTEKQFECGPIGIDLDFRYSEEKRAYTNDHIIDFLDILLEELHILFTISNSFPIYVFEKPNINVKPTMIKDGIHIIVGVNLDVPGKTLLRSRLLKKMGIWDNLKLLNNWDSVLDENVFKGSTVWQLYGSQKPGHDAYKLTYVYTCQKDNSEYELHCSPGDSFPLKTQLYKLSIRNLENETPVLKEEFKQDYENARQRKKLRVVSVETAPTSNEITTPLMLNSAIEKLFASLEVADYLLQEIHAYVMCLPASYYDEYNKWVRVGWALRNTDYRLFLTWVKFSSQSAKFSFSDRDNLQKMWNSWEREKEGLTMRSIMYWARTENEEAYEEIKEKSINLHLEEAIKDTCTEFDIASILYQCYKDTFVCVDIKSAKWFQYQTQRWTETDSGTELRKKITSQKGLFGIFAKKLGQVSQQMLALPAEDDRHKAVKKKHDKIHGIMVNMLKKQGDKIMKEASHTFYVKNFLNMLDSKNDILCFTNGVIDFTTNKFRDGVPEDYTHKCTNIPYIDLKLANQEIVKEVTTFMCQLFPDQELREYMWDHAASMLSGKNTNQTFNIYIGSGRNGKSKFVELLSGILGDYKATVPVSLITKQRTIIGGASPEVAGLVGVRLAVMQESSVSDQINEGPMKELTGGDMIQCRALYRDPISFIPQFKLVMPTNNLPGINGKDEGTWRRIRACEFKSEFKENPDTRDKYQFVVDKNLDLKFELWKPVFMSMLVERAYITKGNVVDCKMVLINSEKYRKDQDYLSSFVKDCVIEHPTGILRDTELYDKFSEWWKLLYGKNVPMGKDLFNYMEKLYGKRLKRIGTVWRGLKVTREEIVENMDDI